MARLHKRRSAQDDDRIAIVHLEFKVQEVTATQGLHCMCCLDANRGASAAPCVTKAERTRHCIILVSSQYCSSLWSRSARQRQSRFKCRTLSLDDHSSSPHIQMQVRGHAQTRNPHGSSSCASNESPAPHMRNFDKQSGQSENWKHTRW